MNAATEAILSADRASIFFDGQYSEPRLFHPEGVAVGPDGSVWCGTGAGDVFRIEKDGSGARRVATTGGFALGLAFDGADHLFVCDQKSASVWRLTLSTGAFAPFTAPGIRIPNYPVVDAARGVLYVSDSFGREAGPGVWRYDLSTGEGELWWRQPMQFANGMALGEGGAALYVAETFGRKVSRIEIGADGAPAGISDYATGLPGLPDGLAFDDAGNLYISCYEPSRIVRVDRSGRAEIYAEDKSAETICHPTNIAFDGAALYSANLGRWHITRIATGTSGLSLHEAAQRARNKP